VFEHDHQPHSRESVPSDRSLTNPTNKVLESGAWTQSIIWSPTAPFRDFTALELNEEEAPEERLPGMLPHAPLIFVDLVGSRDVQV
jgi:transcription initiation factor TFIID subunit 1